MHRLTSRSQARSPAQQRPFGRPPRFQPGVSLLLLFVCHNLLAGIAALPYARFRGEYSAAAPARFRDRLIERKDARFLGQEIRIMKFAVTHTKQPPSSWRRAACLADMLVPPGVSDSPFSCMPVKPTIVLFSHARWQPKKTAPKNDPPRQAAEAGRNGSAASVSSQDK